jgi:hypothetical protein
MDLAAGDTVFRRSNNSFAFWHAFRNRSDREGRIVNTDAERPSSREKLYAQLDKLL